MILRRFSLHFYFFQYSFARCLLFSSSDCFLISSDSLRDFFNPDSSGFFNNGTAGFLNNGTAGFWILNPNLFFHSGSSGFTDTRGFLCCLPDRFDLCIGNSCCRSIVYTGFLTAPIIISAVPPIINKIAGNPDGIVKIPIIKRITPNIINALFKAAPRLLYIFKVPSLLINLLIHN